MSTLRVFRRDYSIALATKDSILEFKYTSSPTESSRNVSSTRCLVEFAPRSPPSLEGYRLLGEGWGTLGLISLNNDVFICVATGSSRAATPRPGENVLRIDNVDFYCLNRLDYEHGEDYQSTTRFAAEDLVHDNIEDKEMVTDHPFLALKTLLGDGSFYYSLDFNLTDHLQDRSSSSAAFDIDNLNEDMLWNSYMIAPLLLFRSRLSKHERDSLDASRILTLVIRGFAGTLTIPASTLKVPQLRSNMPSTLTVISRLSSRRAGTRFNSRGIDDDGNVANFVETETILRSPTGVTFSYVQARGSVPVFWEQAPGLIPGQQKIDISRSFDATKYAFDKHFEALELKYGAVHIINLLSESKPGEYGLSAQFRKHVSRRTQSRENEGAMSADHHLQMTEYDFHAETKGPLGYEASSQIRYLINVSLDGFGYFLAEDPPYEKSNETRRSDPRIILQQEGVFRTNCLDCLDRTNLIQTNISLMVLGNFLHQLGTDTAAEIRMRHSSLWADNGDALSRIYAGTGALKSSFTRHGKMSLAGAFADARKSATRLYVNTFGDKARQNTIDVLMGRLANQVPVDLYDPLNDIVSAELERRVDEYTSSKNIRIWVGSFNVNGRSDGAMADLSSWLFALREKDGDSPSVVVVAFQEIVELSPQQIMSTDPEPRMIWENAVKDCLNAHAHQYNTKNYVLLRSGQLVGTALLVYVREDAIHDIKNVEGSVKKTGLSGMAGNKGGCAIRLEFSNTRICFVTAHLAAGFANYDERNRDYATISNGLRFRYNRSIEDHDAIIWLGDFNYRIGAGDREVRQLIKKHEYGKLYENDQLNLQMIAGRTFPFYSEGLIQFPPTYKFDFGSDEYDTSEKARIPAWCDRILWKGTGLKQIHYCSADLKTSDHRPVFALFDCSISIVNEGQKDRLNRLLYDQRRTELRDAASQNLLLDSDDDEAADYTSPASGLPPASSDRHKWWLDRGCQVRSGLQPDAPGNIPDIIGKPNPFSGTGQPDWVNPQFLLGQESMLRPTPSLRSTGLDARPSSDMDREFQGRKTSKPEVPRKPAILVPRKPTPPTRKPVSPQHDGALSRGGFDRTKPVLPPRVPPSGTTNHTPIEEKVQSLRIGTDTPRTTNLLDDADNTLLQEWKPLSPGR
ncbi:Polyphosphatidylinositol phosphatase INP52 [Talaromyces islandicus]|uniref:phosphoinositide 5-phosphatase n=1 Tax=Talaromyces islandicus TaxID=28573 RepID=A0A0U1M399_TALIS|nr:Polyphosphatidylinositol phosphatase INP52 [Talaromyces islandicus]